MTIHSVPHDGRALPLDWLVSPALAFDHPSDVLIHPDLTNSERKAILASWASDARAVEGMPWLRQLENGATVALSDVLAALQALDRGMAGPPPAAMTPPRRRRRFGDIVCRRTEKRIPVEYR